MRVIVAAAGTAGHINPGLAIANKIKQEQPKSEIIFIGTSRGLENDLVPRAGYELKTIEAYGLSKKISFDNLKKLFKTYRGLGQAKKIVKQFKPDIVIGVGGYVTAPVIYAAHKLKIKTIIHEQNSILGMTNKFLSKYVDALCISFPDTKSKAKRVVRSSFDIKLTSNDTIPLKGSVASKATSFIIASNFNSVLSG